MGGETLEKIIVKYQKAYNKIIDKLKSKDNVLAIMVFGSMVTGDIWNESDIDLFVVTKDEPSTIKNIYTEERDVPIHIKLMSKDKFLQLHESDLRGGFIHRIFASSKLVLSKDTDITNRYNDGRYYPDIDRERWNVVYLGKVLKGMSSCKKYLQSGRKISAYSLCVDCIQEYSKLYINFSGHMVSNDAMSTVMNLNGEFKECVENLFNSNKAIEESIEAVLSLISIHLDMNIKNMAHIILEFMDKSKMSLSAEDIKGDKLFEGYNIEVEEILNELHRKNIIKKCTRDFVLSNGEVLIKEKVYSI